MTEAKFIEKHNQTWKALETSLRSPVKSFKGIQEQVNLYRAVIGHLSYAQSTWERGTLCNYLSELTSKAHSVIYIHTDKDGSWIFLSKTMPQQLRASASWILISAVLFIASALLSFGLTTATPHFAYAFLPDEYTNTIPGEDGGSGDWVAPIMSSVIMVNNIRVSVLAFCLGLTCGIGTVYVLMTNGFMLGSLAAVFTSRGESLVFWSLILPHGIWELTAIFIAGGAGLKLGYSLIRPGVYRRQDALLRASRSITGLITLVVILLIAAGIIEGFFTPSDIDPALKLVFAALTAVVLIIYFTNAGFARKESEARIQDSECSQT